MRVTITEHTQDAVTQLLRTKNTRLGFSEDPAEWTIEQRHEHLRYMRDTIKSSWEFVNFTFLIEDVSRAFTHQLVRTRAGHYAQESQRTVDVRDNGAWSPDSFPSPEAEADYHAAIDKAFGTYRRLVDAGVPPQNARGVLPTATLTSIVAGYNLRTLSEMARIRLCHRTQGEYQAVFREMKARVLELYPEFEPFLRVNCAVDGICAFPRYKECPLQPYTYNGLSSLRHSGHVALVQEIAQLAEKTTHEAVPKAHAGRTM